MPSAYKEGSKVMRHLRAVFEYDKNIEIEIAIASTITNLDRLGYSPQSKIER